MFTEIWNTLQGGPQELFNRWWWGYSFIPFYLSLLSGTIGANIIIFNDLKKEAADEMWYISRRLFPDIATRSLMEWELIKNTFGDQFSEVINKFAWRNFHGMVFTIMKVRSEILDELTAAINEAPDLIDPKREHREGTPDYDRYKSMVDAHIRNRLRRYIDAKKLNLTVRLIRRRPEFFEMLGMPTFARWQSKARGKLTGREYTV